MFFQGYSPDFGIAERLVGGALVEVLIFFGGGLQQNRMISPCSWMFLQQLAMFLAQTNDLHDLDKNSHNKLK